MMPLDTSRCKARGKAFLLELENLCKKHAICISLYSYEGVDFVLQDISESDAVIEGPEDVWDELSEET